MTPSILGSKNNSEKELAEEVGMDRLAAACVGPVWGERGKPEKVLERSCGGGLGGYVLRALGSEGWSGEIFRKKVVRSCLTGLGEGGRFFLSF